MRCTAKSKRSQKQCKNYCRTGQKVCHIHGGKSLKGEAHPNFKDGKFSNYMPQRLLKIYEDVQADDEHNILSRNIRLRETFLREKLVMIDDVPDSAKLWQELRGLVDELTANFESQDYGHCHIGLMQIHRLIDEKEAYHKAVAEIRGELAEQRKDKQAIATIEFKGESAIPVKELLTLMGGVLHVIQTVVTDKKQRTEIADGIDNLFIRDSRSIEVDR